MDILKRRSAGGFSDLHVGQLLHRVIRDHVDTIDAYISDLRSVILSRDIALPISPFIRNAHKHGDVCFSVREIHVIVILLDHRELRVAREGRAQLIDAFEFLTKYDPEFRNLELITSSSVLGVRESRRIRGEYYITKDDILNGARFDDAVAHVCFGADLHTKSNKGQRCFSVKPYHIPMRALIPKGYRGIVVAGRCISGSREAMASYRVTGNCAQMGENAGYYIAQAIKKNIPLLEVRLPLTLTKDPS